MAIRFDIKTKSDRILGRNYNLPGRMVCRQLSYILDSEIISQFEKLSDKNPEKNKLCIYAIGGYGRMELSPFSDVDLLYLIEEDAQEDSISEMIAKINAYLFDSGKEVGHSCRTIPECLEYLDDQKTFHAILDSRFIVGSTSLSKRFVSEVIEKLPPDLSSSYKQFRLKFLSDRLFKQEAPMLETEPDIKNGPCGLRDIQYMFWTEKLERGIHSLSGLGILPFFQAGEIRRLEEAYDFYISIRNILHKLQQKKGDRLLLSYQPEVAELLGFGNRKNLSSFEKFMMNFYKIQKDVSFIIGIWLEEKLAKSKQPVTFRELNNKFYLSDNMLFAEDGGNLFSNPGTLYKNILQLFEVCSEQNILPSRELQNSIRFASNFLEDDFKQSKPAIDSFRKILSQKNCTGKILTIMHETEVLGKLIPEFGTTSQYPLFSYHHQYPVDEHSLFITRELDRLEAGTHEDPILQNEYCLCEHKDLLYLTALLHDAGKVKEGDHCQYGDELAGAVGERLGFSDEEISIFRFLNANHILMSEISQKRDIYDPILIDSFISKVGSRERLRFLYVFTIIDTKCVGKGVLTKWKMEILTSLYRTAWDAMGEKKEHEVSGKKERLSILRSFFLEKYKLSHTQVEEILKFAEKIIPDNYMEITTPRRMLRHFRDCERITAENPVYSEFEKEPAFITLTAYSKNNNQFITSSVACISSEGYNLIGLRNSVTEKGIAIVEMQFTDNLGSGKIDDPSLIRLRDKISDTVTGKINPEEEINSILKWMETNITPEGLVEELVEFDNDSSPDSTILEVRLPDTIALLYRILKIILSYSVQLNFLRIMTSKDYAHDVFYLKTLDGNKIEDMEILKTMADKIKNLPIKHGEPQ